MGLRWNERRLRGAAKGYNAKSGAKTHRELRAQPMIDFMVELSGIEPLASSLRIQRVDSDGAKPKNTK